MKVGISGIAGRMGREIFYCALEKGINVCFGIESEAFKGFTARRIFPTLERDFPIITSPEEFENYVGPFPDVIIDFSVRGAIIPYIDKICQKGLKLGLVIGTTGFSPDEIDQLKNFSENIPILLSYNMSRGINMLLKILPEIKKSIPDFDIEIVEVHHRMKKDSPSGTAVKLSEVLSSPDTKRITGRDGIVGPRQKNELGIFAVRGGDVIGEHIVFFLGDGERIEIRHSATSRKVFADGAIYAAQFIYDKLKKVGKGFFSSIF